MNFCGVEACCIKQVIFHLHVGLYFCIIPAKTTFKLQVTTVGEKHFFPFHTSFIFLLPRHLQSVILRFDTCYLPLLGFSSLFSKLPAPFSWYPFLLNNLFRTLLSFFCCGSTQWAAPLRAALLPASLSLCGGACARSCAPISGDLVWLNNSPLSPQSSTQEPRWQLNLYSRGQSSGRRQTHPCLPGLCGGMTRAPTCHMGLTGFDSWGRVGALPVHYFLTCFIPLCSREFCFFNWQEIFSKDPCRITDCQWFNKYSWLHFSLFFTPGNCSYQPRLLSAPKSTFECFTQRSWDGNCRGHAFVKLSASFTLAGQWAAVAQHTGFGRTDCCLIRRRVFWRFDILNIIQTAWRPLPFKNECS